MKKVIKYLFGFFCLISLIHAKSVINNDSGNIVNGWQYIAVNNFDSARECFQKAIAENPDSPRPYLALTFIEELLDKKELAWDLYKKALSKTNNPNPYIFAAMLTDRGLISPDVNTEKGLIELLPDLENSPDSTGVLRAGALERLGTIELEYGDISDAEEYFEKVGAIGKWKIIGPFENISASGYEKVFEPEQEFNTEKEYLGKNEIPVKWFDVNQIRRDRWLDFNRYFAANQSIYYGNTFVYSPIEQDVQIRFGTSGSVKFFLNDDLIFGCIDENNNDLDTYIIETRLQQGWNRMLIKCGHSEINQCNFLVRITDSRGYALNNIEIKVDSQDYVSHPNVDAKFIRNFAEIYFEKLIEDNPDHIENYLLLSECYLRNDKAPEAERILRKIAERMPKSVLIKDYLLEAYVRGEKNDEVATVTEQIYSMYPDIPHIIELKYTEHMNLKDFEKAEKLATRYIELLPDNSNSWILKVALSFIKGDMNNGIAILSEAREKFPNSWDVTYLSVIVSVQTTGGYDEAIKLLKNYSEYRRSENVYLQLADNYLKGSRVQEYEECFNELIHQDPAASGIYFNLATVFNQLQQYNKADEYINKAMEICPFFSNFWAIQGQIYQNQLEESKAIASYKTAIKYNPKDYDSRTRLRKLEGRDFIFNNFYSANIDSLIKNAPTASDYPDDNVIYLLDDQKRVIYDRGGSEVKNEVLIRVFNADAIDSYKDYWLPYNRYSEKLTIDKAVVIKQDGTEIKADISDNQIVFKSLEPNDFMYILWRKQSFNSGKLSAHLWEEINFNYYAPAQNVSYSLLVPEDFNFVHKTQKMKDEPVIRNTPDGLLYEWRLYNQPSIKTEYDMPTLDDVGKMLFISSIPDWKFMVDWYLDLTKDKTRVTDEIQYKVDELLSESPDISELEKIKVIYNYITENIRYSSVSFRQSGLVPQKARKVLAQRIGDCKDVATLCIAMLNAAGISSHYVLVNTFDDGLNENILPSLDFNHAIVGVETTQGTIYMDLTAQNYPFRTLPEQDINAFALNICENSTKPFFLSKEHCAPNYRKRKSVVKLLEDNSVEIIKINSRGGIPGASFRESHRFSSESERIKDLTEALADDYPNLTITEFTFSNIEPVSQLLEDTYTFTVPNYLEEAGNMKLLTLPWSDNLWARRALSYETREYDFHYRQEADSVFESMTVYVPEGYEPIEIQPDTEYKCTAAEYKLSVKYNDGVIKAERSFINKMGVVPTDLYKEFKEFYNSGVRSDQQKILLRKVK